MTYAQRDELRKLGLTAAQIQRIGVFIHRIDRLDDRISRTRRGLDRESMIYPWKNPATRIAAYESEKRMIERNMDDTIKRFIRDNENSK